jgi:hypothetical protein
VPTVGTIKVGREEQQKDETGLDALNGSEVADMCGQCQDLAKAILKQKDAARDLEKFTGTLQGRFTNFGMRFQNSTSGRLNSSGVNALLKSLRNIALNRAKLDQAVMKEAYRALSAGYAYALESYKNLD